MRLIAMILTFVSLAAGGAIADPVGSYNVEGTNPGSGSSYRGTVAVEKTGQTFSVTWEIGGSRYVGTGIGDNNFLAVGYRSGNTTGLALYGNDGKGIWVGIWAYGGGNEVGNERWTPR